MSYYVNFFGGLGSNEFHIKLRFGTHGSWKNQNPGGRFGATAKFKLLQLHSRLLLRWWNRESLNSLNFALKLRVRIPQSNVSLSHQLHCNHTVAGISKTIQKLKGTFASQFSKNHIQIHKNHSRIHVFTLSNKLWQIRHIESYFTYLEKRNAW